MSDVLPDSRLKTTIGDVVVDWLDGNGSRVRLTLQPIFCFNCGKSAGYVPRDVMSFVSWLCQPCSVKYGEDASLHRCADSVFWEKVGEEMLAQYGRALTQQELWILAESDRLSNGLKLLLRESPYKDNG